MLDLLFGPARRAASGGWDQGWTTVGRSRTNAGTYVDEDLALTYAAVWCATRVVSETVASIPLCLYRRVAGARELAEDHPLYRLLKYEPNPTMGSMPFREGRTAHQANWGNGFAEIEREYLGDPEAPPVALHPIHPSRVRPITAQDRAPGYSYFVRNNDGTSIALRSWEVLHVPGCLSEDGVWGKGVISHARESIGFGLATERHGARYFGSGAIVPAVVMLPGLRDVEARRNFREEWKQIHSSADSGEIAILPVEAKYEKIGIPPEDSQFLETRKHNVSEIARWYRIPVYMLEEYEKAASFASVEQRGIDFIVYSLMPWLVRWEQQLNLKLLTAAERSEYYFEHNVAGLLRGDFASRMSGYQIGLVNGIYSINDVLKLENMPGIGEAGDAHYVQMNLTTAERMLAGPSAAPPADSTPPDQSNALATATATALASGGRQPPDSPAAAELLRDVRDRFVRKASNAAARVARRGESIDAWWSDYQPKIRAIAIEAFSPYQPLMAADWKPEQAADELLAELLVDLLASRRASAPGQKGSVAVRGLTPPGSPGMTQ